ncbi:HIT family protein [Acinetobacter baumannii]|nr:HIT family protein [Acinetobacter baumannii]
MTECIFCKIINREIPSYPIYEDDDVYAFLDITQTTKGHALVIPKKHVPDLFAYDEILAGTLFSKIPKIANGLEKAFPEMKGLNLINNNKEIAYQTVFHSHIHLIPRYSSDDDFSITFKNNSEHYTPKKMTEVSKIIAEAIQNVE